MATKFMAGVGFALGSQVVGMFLDVDETDISLCHKDTELSLANHTNYNNSTISSYKDVDLETPFQLVAFAQIMGGVIYCIPLLFPMEMPGH